MSDLQLNSYLDERNIEVASFPYLPKSSSIVDNLSNEGYRVALVGLSPAADAIRHQLYPLACNLRKIKIADLGNVKLGKDGNVAGFALEEVVSYLLDKSVIPILIGGSQESLLSVYETMQKKLERQRITILDSMIDLNETDASYLFSFLNNEKVEELHVLGLQNYLCANWQMDALQRSDVHAVRLGEMVNQLACSEPIFRDTDWMNLSFSVVRQSEAPAKSYPMPNGFNGFEICQLAQYAGLSDSTLLYSITDVEENFDVRNQTSALAAQVVWHILTGIDNRFGDYPKRTVKEYERFQTIPEVEGDEGIVFFHNKANGRWWIEIPTLRGKRIFACTKDDYRLATEYAIPDVWMRHYMR